MPRAPFTLIALTAATLAGPAAAGPLPDPVTDADYRPVARAEAELGQLLFYDPVLSGNREVACATCHHPAFGTSDGLSLGIGDGGRGIGPHRVVDPDNLPERRIPRNAQALFNLGAEEFRTMFNDGRVQFDAASPSGMRTPMGPEMEQGFASILSAQTMFPVLSPDEMAGHYSENEVARAVRQGLITGPGGAWDLIARRVAGLPDYAARFEAVYGLAPEEIHFTHISDAIAAFVEFEWRSDSAPFDAALRGEAPLGGAAAEGQGLFYGAAGCDGCHSGPFLTDQDFHAMAEVQVGPGKGERFETHARDTGRMEVTGRAEDAYAFRTPSLRNVGLTAPYGHAGAYGDLAAYLRHHADPGASLSVYDPAQAVLPAMETDDWRIMEAEDQRAEIVAAAVGAPVALSEADIAALVAFLDTLTDPVVAEGRLGVPEEVPSGLPVPTP